MAASCYWRKELLGKLWIPDIIISLSETCNVMVLLGGGCATHCVGSLLIRKTSRSVHRPRAGTLAVSKQLQTQLSCHSRRAIYTTTWARVACLYLCRLICHTHCRLPMRDRPKGPQAYCAVRAQHWPPRRHAYRKAPGIQRGQPNSSIPSS